MVLCAGNSNVVHLFVRWMVKYRFAKLLQVRYVRFCVAGLNCIKSLQKRGCGNSCVAFNM